MRAWMIIGGIVVALWSTIGAADSTRARCDVYPAGSDRADKMIGCTFAQRQGHVSITRADGVTHDLSPAGDAPGRFRDQHGRAVSRDGGLGDQGLIFRFPRESVYVFWSTAALEPRDEGNPTAPFSSADYDATALLRCRGVDDARFGSCPAGALRMAGGEASIVVLSPRGERFTINFMKAYVNATNRKAEARLEGDTWTVVIDGREIYEVPLAMIEGG